MELYFAGNSIEEAMEGLPFDTLEDAQEYAQDNDYEHVWSVPVYFDWNFAEEV